MEKIIELNPNKCTACYACIKTCPVKAIYLSKDSLTPQINEKRCIGCGSCIMACSYDAITPISNIEKVEEILSSNKTAAICDPSIAGEFDDITDYRKFVMMIRKLGFSYVNEVSFGVDIVAEKQVNLLKTHKGKNYITSHCPVMNMYIERFQPSLTDNLSPIIPPFAATAAVVRRLYGEDIKVVNITPCLGAKKININYKGLNRVDAFLSFKELRQLFAKNNIKEENVEYSDFDEPFGNLGSLYPIPNGFVEACKEKESILEGNFITAEGKTDSIDLVNQFASKSNMLQSNINVYFCKGCFMAPGCTKGNKFIRNNFVKQYALKRINSLDCKKWQDNVETYSNKAEIINFYTPNNQTLPQPTKQQIEDAFVSLGKKDEARNTNCRSCGYDSCTELAIAIAQGIATNDMCFSLAKKDNKDYSKQLKVTTENLVELQKRFSTLNEDFNIAKQTDIELKNTLSSLISHLYPAIAIIDNNYKILESNTAFIDILGDDAKEIDEIIPGLIGANVQTLLPKDILSQIEYVNKSGEDILNKDIDLGGKFINISVFTLIANKKTGLIFRNLYTEQERPQEIIHRVNEVIKANLTEVQQIGFILGETASKTEKMLNAIIKTYKEQIGK
ncbi:MAG: 4Fe-4S binding protein [Bacteroidales bacterium]|nr:4Fe-4S binding protein [Bacteroidales bacterium]